MWIVPRNYDSKYQRITSADELLDDDLKLDESLLWRGDVTPLKTWCQRWKRITWFPLLCTRILKPTEWDRFEDDLVLGLKKVPRTSQADSKTGPDRFFNWGVSKKPTQSDAEYKKEALKKRKEYSRRAKYADVNVEKWPTPAARDYKGMNSLEATKLKIQEGKQGHAQQLPNAVMLNEDAGIYREPSSNPDWPSRPKERQYEWEEPRLIDGRLNPDWVEQLMDIPVGWTNVNKKSNNIDRLILCGNGVVPLTIAKAFIHLNQKLL